jgi:hypothetical protein
MCGLGGFEQSGSGARFCAVVCRHGHRGSSERSGGHHRWRHAAARGGWRKLEARAPAAGRSRRTRQMLDSHRLQRRDVEDVINSMLGRDPDQIRPFALSWGPLIDLLDRNGISPPRTSSSRPRSYSSSPTRSSPNWKPTTQADATASSWMRAVRHTARNRLPLSRVGMLAGALARWLAPPRRRRPE